MNPVDQILKSTLTRNRILSCTRCDLSKSCLNPVPGTLIPTSNVAIIGEAPGKIEDIERKPFVGKAGQEARRWLGTWAGLNPLAVSWLNVVCCYPNRTPDSREVEACRENLTAQLDAIQPEYVLVLGAVALKALLPLNVQISDLHGYWWKMPAGGRSAQATATYHPAATLRNFHLLAAVQTDVETFGIVVREEAEMEGNSWCARCHDGDVVVVWREILGFCRKCAGKVGMSRAKREYEDVRLFDAADLLTSGPETGIEHDLGAGHYL